MQTLLQFLCAELGFDWTSHLSMVEFYYNFFINEATSQSPFEVMYGFQPSTFADRLLTLTGTIAEATDKLAMIAYIKDDVYQLIKLLKEIMTTRSNRIAPFFQPEDHVYLLTKSLHIWSQKCKHLRDQRLDPFKAICKVGINSYKLLLPKG
jgi:hypothetical protein